MGKEISLKVSQATSSPNDYVSFALTCEFRMDNNEQFAYAVREERNMPICAEQCTCG